MWTDSYKKYIWLPDSSSFHCVKNNEIPFIGNKLVLYPLGYKIILITNISMGEDDEYIATLIITAVYELLDYINILQQKYEENLQNNIVKYGKVTELEKQILQILKFYGNMQDT